MYSSFTDGFVPLLFCHQLPLVVVGVEAHPVEGNGGAQHGVCDPENLTNGKRLISEFYSKISGEALDCIDLWAGNETIDNERSSQSWRQGTRRRSWRRWTGEPCHVKGIQRQGDKLLSVFSTLWFFTLGIINNLNQECFWISSKIVILFLPGLSESCPQQNSEI